MLDQDVSWRLGCTRVLAEARGSVYVIPSNQLCISAADGLELAIFSYPLIIIVALVTHRILSFSRL